MTSHYAVLGALPVALATLVGALSTRTTHGASDAAADGAATSAFTARLTEASTLRFPHDVDSNSPAVWLNSGAVPMLRLFQSTAEMFVSTGPQVESLGRAIPAPYIDAPEAGKWLEAAVPDARVLYGWYHNEPPIDDVCPGDHRTMPRIGAVRSENGGLTWHHLGIVLESPLAFDCASANRYFVGGAGDFSAQLDADGQWLYLFFSVYGAERAEQGLAFARMAWADRDEPMGRFDVWQHGAWLPQSKHEGGGIDTPKPTAVFGPSGTWHDDSQPTLAFWGPSVHWNTHIEQYVMLLNRAADPLWHQEGIYTSFAPTLSDPTQWSTPVKLLAEGEWYPQVIGLDASTGTDKVAGRRARFYMRGRSDYFIEFSTPD